MKVERTDDDVTRWVGGVAQGDEQVARKIRGASVFSASDSVDHLGEVGVVLGTEPTPEVAARVSDECTASRGA